MQRGDHALDRVVEQHRADADLHAELEPMAWSWLKNGSYWRTGLPLLLKTVQPLPTQRGSDDRAAVDDAARLGLDLLLDLAAEAVGVGEADLDLELRPAAADR